MRLRDEAVGILTEDGEPPAYDDRWGDTAKRALAALKRGPIEQ
jgi:hypothetical protein